MPVARGTRNIAIESAVTAALDRIDFFLSPDAKLELPEPQFRRACDGQLSHRAGSVRTATLFLVFYRLVDSAWRLDTVPVGVRGEHGDKKLSEELTRRHLTLHDAITAFGENLGWKGNVRNVKLARDPRFSGFMKAVEKASSSQQRRIADYVAQQFAASRRNVVALPPIGPDVLTYTRARVLLHALLDQPSEGHIQQFVIAGLLHTFRVRSGIQVVTHHPHASDKFDSTAGDIEERVDGRVTRAYEVTVRADWKNRLSGFREKMDHFALSKYVIIASGINSDDELSVPAKMAVALEPIGRDLAVVDIADVVNFLAAELTAVELRAAINEAYKLLCEPRLSGRHDFIRAFADVVGAWLDQS